MLESILFINVTSIIFVGLPGAALFTGAYCLIAGAFR